MVANLSLVHAESQYGTSVTVDPFLDVNRFKFTTLPYNNTSCSFDQNITKLKIK